MHEYYKVLITLTAKGMFTEGEYHQIGSDHKEFTKYEDVKEFLKKQYGNCKKVKMYRDTKEGEPVHIGWIYCFKCSDKSAIKDVPFLEQDWVEVRKVYEEAIV